MISLIYPVYNIPEALLLQQTALWRQYDPQEVELILVDDCSDTPLKAPSLPLAVTVARIATPIPWNQPAARNLGGRLSSGDWLFFTDQDHFLEPEAMQAVTTYPKKESCAYYLKRECRYADGRVKQIRQHWGTVLLHRFLWAQVGLWDEDFCGHHGYDDIMFFSRLAGQTVTPAIMHYTVTDYADHSLSRDDSYNKRLLDRKLQQHNRGTYKPQSPQSFEWSLVCRSPST
jgi:glycosyltransferase involved in cell wall biosynthesis